MEHPASKSGIEQNRVCNLLDGTLQHSFTPTYIRPSRYASVGTMYRDGPRHREAYTALLARSLDA